MQTSWVHHIFKIRISCPDMLYSISGTNLSAPVIQSSSYSTPGYVSYNIGDGSCYKYFNELVPQYKAEIRCSQDNAQLIAVNSSVDITIAKALTG